jgi:hypothetical protein
VAVAYLSFWFVPPVVQAANADLRLSPPNGSYQTNQTIPIAILLDSPDTAIAGLQIKLRLPEGIEYTGVDSKGSVFGTEVSPPKAQGREVTFTRVRFDTGFRGVNGMVLQLQFRAKAAGNYAITVDRTFSEVIAYGDSANVLQSALGTNLTVVASAANVPSTGSNASLNPTASGTTTNPGNATPTGGTATGSPSTASPLSGNTPATTAPAGNGVISPTPLPFVDGADQLLTEEWYRQPLFLGGTVGVLVFLAGYWLWRMRRRHKVPLS